MMNEFDLRKEVRSLDMLIGALSFDLAQQRDADKQPESADGLLMEMEEALRELRRSRGFRKILLSAIESRRAPVNGKMKTRRAANNSRSANISATILRAR